MAVTSVSFTFGEHMLIYARQLVMWVIMLISPTPGSAGIAEFAFKVVGPHGFTFHIVDRYSSMRSYYKMLRKNLDDSVSLKSLPNFPQKKMFNTLDKKFLDNRMT